MPRLDPRVLSLRLTVSESVQKLLDEGKVTSEKQALEKIFYKTRKANKCPTGFSMNSFAEFYRQYKDFKRSKHFHENPPAV